MPRIAALLATLLLGSALIPATAQAQQTGLPRGVALDPWPGADYDPAIPTMQAVLGYAPGEEITSHADTLRYLEALAAAAPDRVRLVEYGHSWQGRRLVYAIVTSAENMARLDAIKGGMQRLSDPRRLPQPEAENLIAGQPAPVWLAYSVHGDEVGPTDAALMTAYHLVAARGDGRVGKMLAETVVLINPLQNPDGRERFIFTNRAGRGLAVDPDPLSAERDQPWPGGRFNHYVFDMNRDWFAQTQPETRGQTRAMLEWFPVAVADVHEMGTDATYFFPPAAAPTNPWITNAQNENRELVGRTNAKWFDSLGLDYFTREIFDLFYPGYGDGWPTHYGAVAMTYEQGSARGLAGRRSNGTVITYADTVQSQMVASLATVEAVAENRRKFLRDFYQYRSSAIEEGRRAPNRTLILPPAPDRAGTDKLAGLLVRQGIEIGRATAAFTACGQDYPAGSYVIDSAQPSKRLIRVLLDKQIDLEGDFVAEQERRRAAGLPDEIYDVTAWSLPLLYNVPVEACSRPVEATPLAPVAPDFVTEGTLANTEAKVAFLVAWGDAAAGRFLTGALQRGLAVKSSDEAFTIDGRRWPAGSLIVEVADNGPDLAEAVAELARASGADAVGVDQGWVTDGPNFGSNKVVEMRAPRIALAWDRPTQSTAAGAVRYVLERQFGWPVTVVRTDRLARAELGHYDVVILPQGDYAGTLGRGGAENLRGWVRRGGVLIGLGGAMRYLADPDTGLLSVRREDAVVDGDKKGNGKADDKPPAAVPGKLLETEEAFGEAIAPAKRPPDAVAGVLARAKVDAEHWMGAGVAETVHAMVGGSDIFTPVTLDEGVNVARFLGPDALLASGYLWEENRKQLAFKPLAVVKPEGRGYVIGFTADPTFRGFMDGLNVLFLNAVFRGAAHAAPVR